MCGPQNGYGILKIVGYKLTFLIGADKMGSNILLALVAGFIFVYLGYVLVFPERF